jgi:hypothetical protein
LKLQQWARLDGAFRFTAARKIEVSGTVKSIGATSISVGSLVGPATTLKLTAATDGTARVNDLVLIDAHTAGADRVADHVIVLTKFVPTSPPTVTLVASPPPSTPAATAVFQWSAIGTVDSVLCTLDGVGGWHDCTDPNSTHIFTGIAPGNHEFSISAGNAAGFSTALKYDWIVQNAAAPISVTITSAPPATTYATTASFSFTTAGAVTSLQCSVDGSQWATCTSPKALSGLALGGHVFGVLVGDGSGWNTASAAWQVTTLPAAPRATFTTKPADGPSTSVSFAWTTSSAPDTTECQLDAGAFAACSSPDSRTVTGLGSHAFRVRVTNAGGTNTTTATWNVTAATGPTVAITSGPTDSPSTSATVNYTITNPAPGGTAPTLTCTLDGGAASPACSNTSNAASVTGSWTKSGLAIGGHTFVLTVSDGTNPAVSASVSWNVLPAAPTVTITSAPSGSTTATTASIAFTADVPSTFTCKLDAGTAAACTSPKAYTGLGVGSHTVTVAATGTASGSGTGSASVSWTVTAGGPTVTLTSTPGTSTAATVASFVWTTTGTITNTDCKLDAGAFAPCTSGQTYTGLATGSHTFVVQVTNTALPAPNTAQASFTWTITTGTPAPVNSVLPTFTPSGWKPRSGTAGTTGTATTGTWTNNPTGYTYQWYRCIDTTLASCDPAVSGAGPIAGATSASYHAVGADIDKYLRVAVTAANAGGSTTAFSNAAPKTQPS